MKFSVPLLLSLLLLNACVVIPQTDYTKVNRCEISTDRKVLKVVNAFEETNSFYSLSGIALVPITGIVTGTYVAVNNTYHLGEERLVCGSPEQVAEPTKG